jgi:hypothetical protein
MKEMDKDISGMLTAYREGSIDLAKFKMWIEAENPRIAAQSPRGQLLKLRHGNDYARMVAIARLLPSCEKCAMIGAPRQFASRQEYEVHSKRRDVLVASGTLRTITPPSWTCDSPPTAEAVMYYTCSTCGSIWVFGEPERAENGFWERLA